MHKDMQVRVAAGKLEYARRVWGHLEDERVCVWGGEGEWV